VVTSFELRAHPVGPDIYFAYVIDPGDDRHTLQAFRDWSLEAPEISALAILWHAPRDRRNPRQASRPAGDSL
jgi:hypothetical protein